MSEATKKDAIANALAEYKRRLEVRLTPIIRRQFDSFLPTFVAQVMRHVPPLLPIPQDDSLYPEGTKFFYKNNELCYVIVEQKPQIRTLSFASSGYKSFGGLKKTNWRLSFPYIIFLQAYHWEHDCNQYYRSGTNGTFLAYSNKPIRYLTDIVYESNLPNINDYYVCLGQLHTSGTIAEQVEQSIAHFWQGIATTDWTGNYYNSKVGSVEEWEKLTHNDPLAVLKTNWAGGISICNLLAKVGLANDHMMHQTKMYTNELINLAAENARMEVVKECQGANTEMLDIELVAQIEKCLKEEINLAAENARMEELVAQIEKCLKEEL